MLNWSRIKIGALKSAAENHSRQRPNRVRTPTEAEEIESVPLFVMVQYEALRTEHVVSDAHTDRSVKSLLDKPPQWPLGRWISVDTHPGVVKQPLFTIADQHPEEPQHACLVAGDFVVRAIAEDYDIFRHCRLPLASFRLQKTPSLKVDRRWRRENCHIIRRDRGLRFTLRKYRHD